ncbi:MAG: DEAD/DEAH box helicase, partial [Bacteroidetes bacterium]|nr:DEAD/DEAH box helicase [Bacteroidota bacterium]
TQWNASKKYWEFPKVHLRTALHFFKETTGIEADTGIKSWFIEIMEHKKKLDDIRQQTEFDIEIPTLLPLYDFQVRDVVFGIEAGGRWINGDQMGLGKTPTAIGFALVMGGKSLVVCPKSVKLQWVKSVIKFAGKESCVWGPKGPEGDINAEFHIINYDVVSRFVSELNDIGFNVLICDEATKLKNYKSTRTKAIFGSWKERKKFPGLKIPYVNLLTGTPILNRPTELFTLLSSLDKKRFNNPLNFIQRYGEGADSTSLLELHERSKELIIRHVKSDVAKDLKKVRDNVWVEMTPSERKEYDAAVTELFKKWRLNGRPSAAHMPALRNLLFEYKFPRVIEYAEELIDSGRPILIFTIQQAHAERIAAHFGDRARLITGKITSDQVRLDRVQDVATGKADVMVMTIIAGGMGVDGLQDTVSDTLFVDRWWTPGDHEQAEDRTNRTGQKNITSQNYMTVKDTYDEFMAEILSAKQEIIDLAVEGKIPEDSDIVDAARHGSIFKEVVSRMAKRMKFNGTIDEVEEQSIYE